MGVILGQRSKRGHDRYRRIANLVGHRDPDWWPSSLGEKPAPHSNSIGFIVAIVTVVVFIALAFAFTSK